MTLKPFCRVCGALPSSSFPLTPLSGTLIIEPQFTAVRVYNCTKYTHATSATATTAKTFWRRSPAAEPSSSPSLSSSPYHMPYTWCTNTPKTFLLLVLQQKKTVRPSFHVKNTVWRLTCPRFRENDLESVCKRRGPGWPVNSPRGGGTPSVQASHRPGCFSWTPGRSPS